MGISIFFEKNCFAIFYYISSTNLMQKIKEIQGADIEIKGKNGQKWPKMTKKWPKIDQGIFFGKNCFAIFSSHIKG